VPDAAFGRVRLIPLFAVHPTFTDVYPDMGPAQGGTTITVHGREFPIWEGEIPAIQVTINPMLFVAQYLLLQVAVDTMEYRVDIEQYNTRMFTFDAPPQLVNETDLIAETTLYISFNRQRYYQIPYVFRQYGAKCSGSSVTP